MGGVSLAGQTLAHREMDGSVDECVACETREGGGGGEEGKGAGRSGIIHDLGLLSAGQCNSAHR